MIQPPKRSSRQRLLKLSPQNLYRFKELYKRLGSTEWTKKAIQEFIIAYDIACSNRFKEFKMQVGLNYKEFKHFLPLNKEAKFLTPVANGYTPGVQSRIYTVDDGISQVMDEIDMEYDKQRTLPQMPIVGSNFGFSIEAYYKVPRKQRDILRNHIIGTNDGYYVVKNEEKKRYRVFSVFTRLSEESRKFTTVPVNNDLSAGLQTLMMQFYKLKINLSDEELEKKYFYHSVLTYSSDNKQKLRKMFSEVAKETIEKVKRNLTKISYGGMKKEFNFTEAGFNKIGVYKDYYKEEISIRDFVVKEFDTLLDDKELREYYEAELNKKKRNKREIDNLKLYTFMEYYERLIRDIMIELNPNVRYQHVHDSLWTSEDIDLEEVKAEVKKRIGFSIQF